MDIKEGQIELSTSNCGYCGAEFSSKNKQLIASNGEYTKICKVCKQQWTVHEGCAKTLYNFTYADTKSSISKPEDFLNDPQILLYCKECYQQKCFFCVDLSHGKRSKFVYTILDYMFMNTILTY